MIDKYVYIIIALLPLTALILVFQVNPYHALVIRAILGAVAALVDAVLGAADVALTEALVGTMLGVTLYVIAVRSSLVMRLGIIKDAQKENHLKDSIANIKKIINRHHLRLEIIEYPNIENLDRALLAKEVHGIFSKNINTNNPYIYQTKIRIHRLYKIMQEELKLPEIDIKYLTNKSK